MDHTFHHRLEAAELNEKNLTGATIYDGRDETIGTISHLHGDGASIRVIVDVGGFLGIGTKPVALQLNQLDVMRDDNGTVHAVTDMTRDQVEALPEHHH
ncbi:PRC-barrel domain containing protein [Pseudorhodobacter turbinis]|uniref:PRC-barrel domain containing protein n=1 Tax=Pseudorhodobacter turbinis TaxID=2500533 RepID=A0A4P8ED74_9RHOB|nr:PRC-barrel domain-containing protein [Pseudorhodobacter turbinis]QCO54726.1 PRC-barrel domain containing protein [Pseudorhodobacter turbinis]